MLDGLDEVNPELRDQQLIPWLQQLIKNYPQCHYLISTRPVGYPQGVLEKLDFTIMELESFEEQQIQNYCKQWCIGIYRARNELAKEAKIKGTEEGNKIYQGILGRPEVRNLVTNPLMLSTVCIIYFYYGGRLPDDRAQLYQYCVEGLLHHWDQRKQIHSEFRLDEKQQVCQEIAIAMQSQNMAEISSEKALSIIKVVLPIPGKAEQLLEHIRYRTGLLVERRTGFLAFAHLTFQEYLAAVAVREGNQLGIDEKWLIREHHESRWKEVLPLFCGITSSRAKHVLEQLCQQELTEELGELLADSYQVCNSSIKNDRIFTEDIIKSVAIAPFSDRDPLFIFWDDWVAPIANSTLATRRYVTNAWAWIDSKYQFADQSILEKIITAFQFEEDKDDVLLLFWVLFKEENWNCITILNQKLIDFRQGKAGSSKKIENIKRNLTHIFVEIGSLNFKNENKIDLLHSLIYEILHAYAEKISLKIKNERLYPYRSILKSVDFTSLGIPPRQETWLDLIDLLPRVAHHLRISTDLPESTDHPRAKALESWAALIEEAQSKVPIVEPNS